MIKVVGECSPESLKVLFALNQNQQKFSFKSAGKSSISSKKFYSIYLYIFKSYFMFINLCNKIHIIIS